MITLQDFNEVCESLSALFVDKNRRYKDSFETLFAKFGLTSTTIRLSDKVNRLEYLCKDFNDCGDETVTDTLKDIANYAIMTLVCLEKKGKEN